MTSLLPIDDFARKCDTFFAALQEPFDIQKGDGLAFAINLFNNRGRIIISPIYLSKNREKDDHRNFIV